MDPCGWLLIYSAPSLEQFSAPTSASLVITRDCLTRQRQHEKKWLRVSSGREIYNAHMNKKDVSLECSDPFFRLKNEDGGSKPFISVLNWLFGCLKCSLQYSRAKVCTRGDTDQLSQVPSPPLRSNPAPRAPLHFTGSSPFSVCWFFTVDFVIVFLFLCSVPITRMWF